MARTHYPRGQVTLDSAVMVNVDNFGLDLTNSVALKGTLADADGIPVDGMRSATITFDILLSNDQTERVAEVAAITAVLNGTGGRPFPIGYKNGQLSVLTSVTPSSVKLADKLGEAAMLSVTALGKVTDTQGM